jgi:hypothetical protein
MNEADLATLSDLQRKLLRIALLAHWREAADITAGARDPGCFGIRAWMRQVADRRARACHRASIGRALHRLIRRGIVESPTHGAWKLTPRGVTMARACWPELRRPGELALEAAVASWLAEHPVKRRSRARSSRSATTPTTASGPRVAVDWCGRALCPRPRDAQPKTNATTASGPNDGIEVEMDF